MKDAADLVGAISAHPRGRADFRDLLGDSNADGPDAFGEAAIWLELKELTQLEERLPEAQPIAVAPTLGDAMSQVIDSLAASSPSRGRMNVTVRFSNHGPKASIACQGRSSELAVEYQSADGDTVEPAVERSVRMSNDLLTQLADIIHDEPAPVVSGS